MGISADIQAAINALTESQKKTFANVWDAIGTVLEKSICPIGTIQAWHKSFPNTPALPTGWVECNGQVLADTGSPYNGQTIPNLNGGERFLRGSATSGTNQGFATEDHTHQRDSSGRNESYIYVSDGGTYTYAGGGTRRNSTATNTGGMATGTADTETRPINMSVVWIMRVK